MKQITYNEYIALLDKAILNNPKVALNCSKPLNDVSRIYFKSLEGCSFLDANYYFGGLFRFAEGKENLTELHLKNALANGGYFLECYEGVLSDMYAKQGFSIVSRIYFEPKQAKKGWELDSVLSTQPNVVFMSLFPTTAKWFVRYKDNYGHAYNYAKQSILK